MCVLGTYHDDVEAEHEWDQVALLVPAVVAAHRTDQKQAHNSNFQHNEGKSTTSVSGRHISVSQDSTEAGETSTHPWNVSGLDLFVYQ